MTEAEAKDVAEELADLSLDARRAYLADLAKTDEAAVEQIKQALLALWRERDT
jgi:hypothetical protein